MSTHQPGRSFRQPARRTVLRKIPQPGQLTSTPLPGPLPVRADAAVLYEELDPDAPTPAPPRPPNVQATYSSVAPVVATVITPLSTVLDDPHAAKPPRSSWRPVIGGTVLGLAIVGAFVVGARLAQTPPSPAASAAASPPPPVVTSLPATPPVTTVAAAAPVAELHAAPVIAATALPMAPPLPRWNAPVSAPRAAPRATAAVVAAAPVAPPAAPSTAPVASASPAVDDSAPSLVPVIPASAPPEVDPLVRAVKQDIAEEQQERGGK
jgi:hypothetical protein